MPHAFRSALAHAVVVCTALVCTLLVAPASAEASLSAMPSRVWFGTTRPNGPMQSDTIWVQNNGNEVVRNLSVSDNCYSHFWVSNSCFFELNPWGSCSIRVNFTPPSQPGSYNCTIQVTGSDANWLWIQVDANVLASPAAAGAEITPAVDDTEKQ